MRRRRLPLTASFTLTAALHALLASTIALVLYRFVFHHFGASMLLGVLLDIPLLAYHVRRLFAPMHSLFRALAGTVASYRDGDFSFGIIWSGEGELQELVDSHNALGDVLREQRVALVQRELLLDTMVQNTPVSMVLVGPSGHVVHANLAARRMLGEGKRLEGRTFVELLDDAPEALRDAFERGGDAMFTVGDEDDEDIYHLSRRHFRLNGRRHELVLLRQLTAELRRQEVQTWKKVIRVISHELNNSLAPIASLAHSGAELVRRGQYERLPVALSTIEERARHLEGFIRDYARFAKLPAPRTEAVEWSRFLAQLHAQVPFKGETDVDGVVRIDLAQMEQALLNLLKNAHESGSAHEDVELVLRRLPEAWRVDVLDRGQGMNEAVLANALLPFYSTKRNGTGLGLALVREIAEAHGGRVSLANRNGGGLCVSMTLPA
ncbi:sensor histidine kinase [Lysobacter claricitrinus]|uniref:sensor histidine kinase n=1 Tax=Lysobacter claricitrinus TaxID=3367728 RepID=UPI0037DAB614